MKKKYVMFLLTSVLSLFSLNSKASCSSSGASFKENYARNIQDEQVFFIKGVALDVVEYGRHIKVIEDLKGNFTGNTTILVWGGGDSSSGRNCISNEKLDYLALYQENDTLIMLVKPVTYENCVEVFGGYTTFSCKQSVLKLSNGYVTGLINPYIWDEPWQEVTMPWDELQKFLSNVSFVNAFEADSAVWTYLYTRRQETPKLYQTILYGDTVVDNVKWKIVKDNNIFGDSKGLVRTDGKKVVFRCYPDFDFFGRNFLDTEITIYDFSLSTSESVLVIYERLQYTPELYEDFSYRSSIEEIFSAVLNDGKQHKCIMFNVSENDRLGKGIIIEGIGCVERGSLYHSYSHPFFMLIPRTVESLEANMTISLICCQIDGELLYMNPNYLDCEGNKVSNETISDISPKSSISFTDGQLKVTFDGDALFDVAVYNMQGMMLWQTKNNRNAMMAGLDNLPKGVFIVTINSGSYFSSGKIVK